MQLTNHDCSQCPFYRQPDLCYVTGSMRHPGAYRGYIRFFPGYYRGDGYDHRDSIYSLSATLDLSNLRQCNGGNGSGEGKRSTLSKHMSSCWQCMEPPFILLYITKAEYVLGKLGN